ncbi:RsmF rRNA methyltransferase first C-terminal domain-containing protein [Lachnobacterium bovis]|uniref:RsmF rRNA methyltransferase first C-terminal domain-containing protein n=1 Tax=Lachnobacterium bovis TaxID=140626 RepID=UPI0003B7A2BB|nr:RsmF rRNA methyltransferase first C-terminal domain-containing protein [Lachnobacterium bovis]
MLPNLFLDRIKLILSAAEYNDFLASYEIERKHGLRFNLLKANYDTFKDKNIDNIQLSPIDWVNNGYFYENDNRPGKSPYHEAGVYYIQEPSAMAPAAYLDAKPGEYILDLCAAPGGKSTQIASTMNHQGLLVSNEINSKRCKILSENIERMGISNAVVTNEPPDNLTKIFPGFFDKIMVDAPCSGEGMFKKNLNATDEWSTENVEICSQRQDMILDCASKMLAPGGRIVFSTCTFAPEENEGSIYRFLKRHSDFKIVDVVKYNGMSDGNLDYYKKIVDTTNNSDFKDTINSELDYDFYKEELKKTIRLWPHLLKGEGHFVAVLEQTNNKIEKRNIFSSKNKNKKPKELDLYYEFFNDTISKLPLDGKLELFKDQLYLVPNGLPSLSGVRLLRRGLHLGTLLKNRFEPSHALALYLSNGMVKKSVDISYDQAKKFIAGETFPCDKEKGWYLITVNGYSLGWGKMAGKVMKNHYPKGLRKNIL